MGGGACSDRYDPERTLYRYAERHNLLQRGETSFGHTSETRTRVSLTPSWVNACSEQEEPNVHGSVVVWSLFLVAFASFPATAFTSPRIGRAAECSTTRESRGTLDIQYSHHLAYSLYALLLSIKVFSSAPQLRLTGPCQ